MKVNKLDTMHKGWFIGNFIPSVYLNKDMEVAVKYYNQGEYENYHHHKVATEITVIIEGSAKMGERYLTKGDIVTLLPGEETDFEALTEVSTVVVKFPSVENDKYVRME